MDVGANPELGRVQVKKGGTPIQKKLHGTGGKKPQRQNTPRREINFPSPNYILDPRKANQGR